MWGIKNWFRPNHGVGHCRNFHRENRWVKYYVFWLHIVISLCSFFNRFRDTRNFSIWKRYMKNRFQSIVSQEATLLKISLTNVIIALLYPQNTLPLKPKSDVALQLYITTLQERCSAPKACTFFISYCYFDSIQRVKKRCSAQ